MFSLIVVQLFFVSKPLPHMIIYIKQYASFDALQMAIIPGNPKNPTPHMRHNSMAVPSVCHCTLSTEWEWEMVPLGPVNRI